MAPKPAAATTDSPPLPPPTTTTTTSTSPKEGSEGSIPSKQPSRNPSPSSNLGSISKNLDADDAMTSDKGASASASTSHPMTKSSSSSSASNTAEAKDAAGAGPSPYGTRSRNRNGRSRPNYAENEVDMTDYETLPEKKDNVDPKQSTQPANAPSGPNGNDAPPPRAAASSTRKPLPTTDNGKAAPLIQEQHQHNHAGAAALSSSAASSAVATQQPSKKRKAGTQTASAHSKDAQSSAPAPKISLTNSVLRKSLGGAIGYAETNLMSFDDCKARPKNNALIADDGTVLAVNDCVYMVCEPPGEPYYIARIMEFLHKNNDPSRPVDALRVNWFYRPKDFGRTQQDTRQLVSTMHSDISPLNTLRGKCTVKHKSEIPKMDEYRKVPDCFWWEKFFDRYIQKNYDAIPTSQIINVPERVKKMLDKHWQFILVEQGRGKELTSAVKTCKKCHGYCASADSVDCGFCGNTYHMTCVRPALTKKPARGFGWACGPCNLAQERRLEALNAPHLHESGSHAGTEDEEFPEEEEEDAANVDTNRSSPSEEEQHPPPTAEQLHQASLWPYRYLGMHCKIEDALDLDDRIYPRASSRLGPRHQAGVGPWPGRPVKLVKPLEIKKSGRKDGRHSKEVQALIEKDKRERERRPKWIQDEPFSGYIPRGEDPTEDDPNSTATCLWKPVEGENGQLPKDSEGDTIISEAGVDEYMTMARAMWKTLGVPERSTNLEDVARDLLYKNKYNAVKALQALAATDKADFKEPELTPVELKKFEEAVVKFGSELFHIRRTVKTVNYGMITRFWYKWKKTPQGKKIWGNFVRRKGKKEVKKAQLEANRAADEVADDHDDSAFDTEKAKTKKRPFICKFCATKDSRQWRRAPNVTTAVVTETSNKNKDKGTQYIVALCRRCAELWRRYAIQWEDIDEIHKKVAATGGRAWKKKIDEALLKELQVANEMMEMTKYSTPAPSAAPSNAATAPATPQPTIQEPPRKKLKSDRDSESVAPVVGSATGAAVAKKKDKEKDKEKPVEKEKEKIVEKPVPPPPPPMPKPRVMPCDICGQLEPRGDQHLRCRECRMTVHRNCYGIIDNRHIAKWVCDMCTNDKNPQTSLYYKCMLCPIESSVHDFVEPPKISHKKKTEKERERERLEKEMAVQAAEFYQKKQEDLGRPVNPREPLKRTADNNWVHVTCAVFTPEIKFGNAATLEPSEGIPSIPRVRYQELCKVCKTQAGACVACHHCRAPVHVECAYQAGYTLGFDITPVKGSRRDQHNIVTIGGESGTMTAGIWCKEHPPKNPVHRMQDVVDESGMNALQLYARNFKQADLTLTGCARKANLIPTLSKASSVASIVSPVNRRASTTTIPPTTAPPGPVIGIVKEELPVLLQPTGKICITCGTDVSPKWYSIDESQERSLVNGYHGNMGAEAQLFVAQRNHQCHKCKKANRQPQPAPVVVKEESTPPPPPAEVSRSSAQAVQAVQASNSPQGPMSVRRIAPQPWDNPPRQPSMEAPSSQPPPIAAPNLGQPPGPSPGPMAAPPMAAPIAAPPIAVPPMATPMVAPMAAPLTAPMVAPMAAPMASMAAPMAQPSQPPPHLGQPPSLPPTMQRGPPPPPQQYPPPQQPPQATSYGDWRRPSSQHGPHPQPPPSHHHMNGGHPQMPPNSMAPLAAPNHLRPPTLGNAPPPPPALQNGHGHGHHVHHSHGPPPMMNGMPPSPRSHGGPPPPMSNGGPYMPQYHQPHPSSHPPPPPHHLTNGGPPPRPAEHPFGQVMHPQRSPFSTPHGSPPMGRENVMMSREPGGNPPPRPPENRHPSGASASPSLRNLLH